MGMIFRWDLCPFRRRIQVLHYVKKKLLRLHTLDFELLVRVKKDVDEFFDKYLEKDEYLSFKKYLEMDDGNKV